MKPVIVAGHVCVDLTPALDLPPGLEPGRLIQVGPLALSAGGCVANTGLALASLGIPTQLVANAGADQLGRILVELLAASGLDSSGIVCLDGQATSYSIVVDVPGRDRTFWHHIGANSAFDGAGVVDRIEAVARGAGDPSGARGGPRPSGAPGARDAIVHIGYPTHLPALYSNGGAALVGLVGAARTAGTPGARDAIVHIGYPTHLPALYSNGGAALVGLVGAARTAGATVSIDMAEIDPASEARAVDWESLLALTLPAVDVVKASVDDLAAMLPHRAGAAPIAWGDTLVELGAAVAVVTAGAGGLYVRTASGARIRAAAQPLRDAFSDWVDRELWAPPFATRIFTTTGAGDAAAAGFVAGLALGRGPEESAALAAAAAAARISGHPVGDAYELAVSVETGREPQAGWSLGRGGVHRGPRDRRFDEPC